ncbi:hypothetical protein ACFSTH_18980 [Paenibacillus yanchengensis]|uniref:Yip1 domain-containing protein n=1 Tax=Paenibacillus yanchengensis TaxID=2035833 RepID=A0ABW4YLY0_9BACL
MDNQQPPPFGKNTKYSVDMQLLLKLLKDPLYARQLDNYKDTKYGWIGLAVSIVGFFISGLLMSWQFGKNVNIILSFMMNSGSILNGYSGGIMAARILLLGVMSNLSLFISIWLISLWKGGRRRTMKALITRLGAMQYITGAGMIVAGIFAIISMKFALAIIIIILLYTLIVTMIGAMELYEVAEENKSVFLISVFAAYGILLATFMQFIM